MLSAFLAVPASAQAAPFIYVANVCSGAVSQYGAGSGGLLGPLSPPSVATASSLSGIGISPNGQSAYVGVGDVGADGFGPGVVQYAIGADGTLTPKSSAYAVSAGVPVVSPDGKSVYVPNGGQILQFDVGQGGGLTPKSPGFVSAPLEGGPLAISPDGRTLYAGGGPGNGTGVVYQFQVGSGGRLAPMSPPYLSLAKQALGISISPDGKSFYAVGTDAYTDANTIYQFDVGSSGSLTAKSSPTVSAGSGLGGGLVVSPDGKSVYLATFDTIFQFDAGGGGDLIPKAPPSVPADHPVDLAIAADGGSLYATGGVLGTCSDGVPGSVLQYSVGGGGLLTAKSPAAVPAGVGPEDIAVTPLPRVHSTSTSVSCSPSTFAPGDATVCRVTVTDTASAGPSTPTGTVSFINSGAGAFLGSPCTLLGSGSSATCAVFFTSFPRGGRIIAADYGGDATHSASRAITGVTVAVPASTEGCLVFGHGRITEASGDNASFRGLAAATPPRGVEFYRDNGPASAFRLTSTSADAVICTDDATKASVFGSAKINGAGSVEYRIDVQLTAWEWGKDTYRIRLSDGYDSGAQKIRHGDVDIRIHGSEHHHHDANANHDKPGTSPDGG